LVYLAELLVVMTDRLKIVRIHARSVPRVHGDKRFDDDASLTSLTPPGKRRCRDCRVLDAPGRRPVETQKHSLRTTCTCLVVASIIIIISNQESCRDSMPSSL